MLEFEQLMLKLRDTKKELLDLRQAVGYDAAAEKLGALEERTKDEYFWNDVSGSQKVSEV